MFCFYTAVKKWIHFSHDSPIMSFMVLSEKTTNVDRPCQSKILYYRRKYKTIASVVLTLAVFNNLIWILDSGLTLNHFLQHKTLNPDDIISFILIGAYCLFFWSFYLRSIHPFLTTSFQVFSDKMYIYQGPTKKELLFSDIVGIDVHSRNGKKYWFILKTGDGNNIRISMTLVRSHYILDTILKFNPKLTLKKVISFEDIVFSLWKNLDLSGELREARRNFIFSTVYWIIIPTSFIFVFYYKQSPSFNQTGNHLHYLVQTIMLTILASSLPYLLIRLSKKILRQNLYRSPSLDLSSMAILTLGLFSCLGMLYKSDLNLYRRIKVSNITNAPKQVSSASANL